MADKPEELLYYKSYLGQWIVMNPNRLTSEAWWSPDGTNFFQLESTGWGNGVMSVTHPQDMWKGEIGVALWDKGELTFGINHSVHGRPIYRSQPVPDWPTIFISLPKTREVYAIYLIPNGEIICVTSFKYYFAYETMCVYLGSLGKMVYCQTIGTEGSIIKTSKGVMNLRDSTWEGIRLKVLVRNHYEVVEENFVLTMMTFERI